MILVDTAIWIDHLNKAPHPTLLGLLERWQILSHPFVIGELALGYLRQRKILDDLGNLRGAKLATDNEVLMAIEQHSLAGKGLGYVDAHLLTAVMLTPGAVLWTRDRRLLAVADRLGLSANL